MLAAEILARPARDRSGSKPQTLMFFDPDTRELLRTRPNPLTPDQVLRLQGARPAGPPPRPTHRAGHRSAPRQRHRPDHRLPPTVALGRVHAGRIVRVHVSEHTLAIELGDDTRTVRRTTTRPVVVHQGQPPPEPPPAPPPQRLSRQAPCGTKQPT